LGCLTKGPIQKREGRSHLRLFPRPRHSAFRRNLAGRAKASHDCHACPFPTGIFAPKPGLRAGPNPAEQACGAAKMGLQSAKAIRAAIEIPTTSTPLATDSRRAAVAKGKQPRRQGHKAPK